MAINDFALSLIDLPHTETIERINARLHANRQDVEALFAEAYYAYSYRLVDKAWSSARKALALAPQNGVLNYFAAQVAQSAGDMDAAFHLFRTAVNAEPDNFTYLLMMYRELRIRGLELASGIWQHMCAMATAESPVSALMHEALADSAAAFADYDEAVKYYTLAAQKGEPAHNSRYYGNIYGISGQSLDKLRAATPAERQSELEMLLAPANLPPIDNGAITTIVTTNLTKKLEINKHKAPPLDTLIRETLDSYVAVMQPPAGSKLVIYYDMPRDLADPDHAPYLAALEKVSNDFNAELRCRHAAGLKANYLEAVAQIHTPYMMLLEHDWLFSDACPNLQTSFDIMRAHPFINQLRFNKRPNVAQLWEYLLWREPRVKNAPLLSNPTFSNNPHIARMDKIRRDFIPLITGAKDFDTHNMGAGGIEETLYYYGRHLVSQFGFGLVRHWQGCYIWGKENDPPCLTHTGI